MEPALVESVGISAVAQEKAIKTLGFFENIIHFFRPKKPIPELKDPALIDIILSNLQWIRKDLDHPFQFCITGKNLTLKTLPHNYCCWDAQG